MLSATLVCTDFYTIRHQYNSVQGALLFIILSKGQIESLDTNKSGSEANGGTLSFFEFSSTLSVPLHAFIVPIKCSDLCEQF